MHSLHAIILEAVIVNVSFIMILKAVIVNVSFIITVDDNGQTVGGLTV